MTLKEKIERKEQAGANQSHHFPGINQPPPSYRTSQRAIKAKKKRRIRKAILISIASLAFLMCGLIYIPQFFIETDNTNTLLVDPNPTAVELRQQYIADNPDADFDNDGLTNKKELDIGANVYNSDSDEDGVPDGKDKDPIHPGNDLYNTLVSDGLDVKSAYQMDDVLLWADDKESFTKGGVMKTVSGGYRFSHFTGWVKFPAKSLAYKCENNVHTLLKHRETEDAWYIDGNYEVVLVEKEPETIYKFSFFGNVNYISGFAGQFINAILPSKGYITCEAMWLDDTFIDVGNTTTATNRDIAFDENDLTRFGKNSNSLKDLMSVYYSIDDESAVLASLMGEKQGETIVVVYGYTHRGNLLIAPLEGETEGELEILPACTKELSDTKTVTKREWFEFRGCGYDSSNGDTICFMAGAVDLPDNKEPEPEPTTTEPTKPTTPENGEFVNGDKTYYYIDGLPAVNQVIHKNSKGKYEVCKITDKGAFYVDDKGQKKEGKIDIDGKVYVYAEGAFCKNAFVAAIDGKYKTAFATTANAMYCGSDGALVTGWFTASNGGKYYASQHGYIIQKNCFVKNESGSVRYLGSNGRIVTNKLITVGGIEIMLDANGSVINYNYAVNIINNHLVS